MRRSARVELRGECLIVSSWSATQGNFPALVQGDWAESAAEPVTDEVSGSLVRSALGASEDGVPYPDFRNDPEPARRRKMLFKLAKVRSESELTRGMRSVAVDWDDSGTEMKITPYSNGGPKAGFTEMLDQAFTIDSSSSDGEVGAAVRRALTIATDGSET
jgi:hypothetical protein